MSKEDVAYLYWLRCPHHTDMRVDGYIGVTSRSVGERYLDHKYAANNKKSVPYKYPISRAIRKYGSVLSIDEVMSGPTEAMYLAENELRPNKSIGWNVAIGGLRREGCYHKHTDGKLLFLLYEYYVAGVSLTALAADNNISRSHLLKVVVGETRSYLLLAFSKLYRAEVEANIICREKYTDSEVINILNDYLIKCLPISLMKAKYGIGADYVSLLSRGLKRECLVKTFYSRFIEEKLIRINRSDKSYKSYKTFICGINSNEDFISSCRLAGINKKQGDNYLKQNSREIHLMGIGGRFEPQTT